MANNVYYFNPTCELAVANGSFSYMPPRLLRDFEMDCSLLPFVFADADDWVLTERKPSPGFIDRLKDAGFEPPAFVRPEELRTETTLGHLFPWGWSPACHFFLKELKDKCCAEFKESPVNKWEDDNKLLFERKTSLAFLQHFLEKHPLEWLINHSMTGSLITSTDEIELLLHKHPSLVLKAPLSSSGRGIQMIRRSSLSTSNKQWISGIIKQQKYLIAEPFLNKLADFSFQFKINSKGEPEYQGYSFFETNSNGQYKSTLIHPQRSISFHSSLIDQAKEMIETCAHVLELHLKSSLYSTLHRGFMGIDAIIYQEKNQLKIQPCIEINCRMNMGILGLHLEKHIHEASTGKFELFYGKKGEYHQFATHKAQEQPLKSKDGKLSSGFLSLNESNDFSQFGAYILLNEAK